jgi:hypothetical protein
MGEPSGRHVFSVIGGSRWGTESGLLSEHRHCSDTYCIWIFICVTMPSNSALNVSSLTQTDIWYVVYVGAVNTVISTLIEAKGWTNKESCFDSRHGQETFPFSNMWRHSPGQTNSSIYRVPVIRQPGREADRSPDLGPGLRISRSLPLLPRTSSW